MVRLSTTALLLICATLICFGGCSRYETPTIRYVSLEDGQVVIRRELDVTVEAEHHIQSGDFWLLNDNIFYEYSLDDAPWEQTASDTFRLTSLTEGGHTLHVRAVSGDGISGETVEVPFTVDMVAGPNITFHPRRTTGGGEVALAFEDVGGIMSAHIELVCENDCAVFDAFTKYPLSGDTMECIAIVEGESSTRLVIDIAFAGEVDGVSGSPRFGELSLTVVSEGKVAIDPDKTFFRDIANTDVPLDTRTLDWLEIALPQSETE